MAYTRVWSDVTPPGSQAANTIDDEIRNLRLDIHDRMNSLVPDWTVDPIQRFGCRASLSAAQAIVTATNTRVIWNTEPFDVGGLHDNAVNPTRITIPANGNKGIWLFHSMIFWDANAVGIRLVELWKNGAVVAQHATVPGGAGGGISQHVEMLQSGLTVGDFFEINVFQSSGGNLNVQPGAGVNSYFEAIYLM